MNQSQQQMDIPSGQQPQTPAELGYEEEEDRSELKKLQLSKRLLLPIFYYDFTTTQGRRQYCDLVTEDPLASSLMWLPFLILIVFANVHTTAAIWTAAGLNIVSVALEYYHATYKPQYPKFFWLSWVLCVTFVAMGIVNIAITLDPKLLSVVAFTALFVTAVVSTLVRVPFTFQMVQHKVPKETLESDGFLKLTTILAMVWMVIFGVCALLGWFAFVYEAELSKTGEIILASVLPIVLLIVGKVSMVPIAEKLKQRLGMNAAEKEAGGETVIEEIA